jgi:hypothetical protein
VEDLLALQRQLNEPTFVDEEYLHFGIAHLGFQVLLQEFLPEEINV